MKFKNWFQINEDIFPNNVATVYHRTDKKTSIENILSAGFTAGKRLGGLYGVGLYTTFSIDSQFNVRMGNLYGDYLVKYKASNLEDYLICQESTARYVLKENDYKLSDQFNKFGIQLSKEEAELYDNWQKFGDDIEYDKDWKVPNHETPYNQKFVPGSTFTGALGKEIYQKHPEIMNKCRGMIYRGQKDGYCLVKYEPINDGTFVMLAYAEAPVDDENKKNDLLSNKGWITTTTKASIKDVEKLNPDDKRKNLAGLEKSSEEKKEIISDLMQKNDFKKIAYLMKHGKLLSNLNDSVVEHLFKEIIKKGSIEQVDYVIDETNYKIPKSAVLEAVNNNNLDMATHLINKKGYIDDSCVSRAILLNNIDMMKMLLENNAKTDYRSVSLAIQLIKRIGQNNNLKNIDVLKNVLELLVKNNAEINEATMRVALSNFDAYSIVNFDIISYLHEHGGYLRENDMHELYNKDRNLFAHYFDMNADIPKNTRVKFYPPKYIDMLCMKNDLSMIKHVYKERKENLNIGYTYTAMEKGHDEVVKWLVENGCKIHDWAVVEASKQQKYDMVKFLIDNGVNMSEKAISYAMNSAKTPDIKKLIEDYKSSHMK